MYNYFIFFRWCFLCLLCVLFCHTNRLGHFHPSSHCAHCIHTSHTIHYHSHYPLLFTGGHWSLLINCPSTVRHTSPLPLPHPLPHPLSSSVNDPSSPSSSPPSQQHTPTHKERPLIPLLTFHSLDPHQHQPFMHPPLAHSTPCPHTLHHPPSPTAITVNHSIPPTCTLPIPSPSPSSSLHAINLLPLHPLPTSSSTTPPPFTAACPAHQSPFAPPPYPHSIDALSPSTAPSPFKKVYQWIVISFIHSLYSILFYSIQYQYQYQYQYYHKYPIIKWNCYCWLLYMTIVLLSILSSKCIYVLNNYHIIIILWLYISLYYC